MLSGFLTCCAQAPTVCDAAPANNCCAAIGSGSTFTLAPNNPSDNINLTFDNFGEYLAGITKYGASTLRLTIADGSGIPGPCPATPSICRWILHIMEDNSTNVVLPAAAATEWAKLAVYGGVGPISTIPTLPLLQVRVRNACGTSETSTGFVTLASTANFRCIIDNSCTSGTAPDTGPHADQPAGMCTINVDEAGGYLTNPGEYTFIIDYQIKPTLTFVAGVYQLTVKYCLRNGP
ncbi:MAG: hypothetical protein HY063_14765 [Bacteroidetes bacterium]|nr:hypothetical protein [Bacteroidota bacterium]